MNPIYLDYNSTAPLDERVLDKMMPYLKAGFGNASSVHQFGREAKVALEESREKVADLIGAEPSEIYFTSGGTEADNIALIGTALNRKKKRDHIVVSAIEHPAVLEAARHLEKNGFTVDYLGVDHQGFVSANELRKKVTDKTAVVSIMHANNEVGTIQDIKTLAEIAHGKGAAFHTDAVQSAGKIELDTEQLGIDLLAMSGHKILGPKGVGVLYIRKTHRVLPLQFGGHHEKRKRPGTENVPGIVGFAAALELAESMRTDEHRRLTDLAEYFIDGVTAAVPNTYLNGPRDPRQRIPSTVNLSFEFIEGEAIILSLDMKGVAVSSGSACASGSLDPSHVLMAMKVTPELAQGSIRFSMGRYTSRDELAYTIDVLPEIVERLRAMSPLYSKSG